jgi:hypothetical protein
VQTPRQTDNRPGLAALSYRAGTWSAFKESMLARLSSADYPALQPLKTRDDDDFTIAFLDATAMVLDILTFYQERLANESYLRTAGQLRSLVELSRLIGYRPAPGVSASAYVAFTLQQAPGQAIDPTAPPITIPKGTGIQSVPVQGQQPQTFETAADIPAKPDWNALKVQTGQPWAPTSGDTAVVLAGTSTQLQEGDLILIVGDERIGDPTSENWDIKIVATVKADAPSNRTYVTWSEGLGSSTGTPAQSNPTFHVFRQRAALFGYNAIQPILLDLTHIEKKITSYLNSNQRDWAFLTSQSVANDYLDNNVLIDLDAVYPKIAPGGWIALRKLDQPTNELNAGIGAPGGGPIVLQKLEKPINQSPVELVSLYRATSIATISRSDFGLSAKISRVAADTGTNLKEYYEGTRETAAYAQSEQLTVGEQPLAYPLYGVLIPLQGLRSDMAAVGVVALSGTRQKLAVGAGGPALTFVPDDGNGPLPRNLGPGEILTLSGAAPLPLNANGWITADAWGPSGTLVLLHVEDGFGRSGTVQAALANFTLAPSGKDDPRVSEYALVSRVDNASDLARTVLHLQSALTYCYDRTTTTVNANVGLATHGRSVSEILGNGDASTPDQRFTLKQASLTYLPAVTASGAAPQLTVRIDGVAWQEVPTLYNASPAAQAYVVVQQADGSASPAGAAGGNSGGPSEIRFGDGEEGARLPTGQNNVRATYRVGSGLAGNVRAGSLTTLVDRPLGVSGVSNPAPATGGQDAQSVDDLRTNAPQSVLTLGRAVSITDYQNFASVFPGIAKAHAIWIPSGPARGVFLTVAGAGGAALPDGDPTLSALIGALRAYGHPLIPITVKGYVETLFSFEADVQYDPRFDQPAVEDAVRGALSGAFCFAARSFGQAVSVDEVAAVIQAVPGVVAVNVVGLTRGVSSTDGDLASLAGYATVSTLQAWLAQQVTLQRPFADAPGMLYAYLPVAGQKTLPQPAEILVLDPEPGQVVLGVM